MKRLFARHALLPEGWQRDVLLAWDDSGKLTGVTPGAANDGAPAAEWVLPGMVNLHSHAFQRAMAGLTEVAGSTPDSFWTWRELMYRFAHRITPEHMAAIAAQLYAECLRYGYTAVCEFHYLQRDPNGALYADPAETARQVIGAAREAGIGISMLPVLYAYSGFGELALKPDQRRFKTDAHDVLAIVDALERERDAQVEVGCAPHSLRAASIAQIRAVLDGLPGQRPVHIHIAEQMAEVEQCLAYSGRRPVQYLMEQGLADARWCLVHATHLQPAEVSAIANSGAVAGICPTTEANLGDGLFPLGEFLSQGGRFGVGSDSHVSQSPVEELRWLEYGQRLKHQSRNMAASEQQRRVGDFLWQSALAGGAQASGRPLGALAVGKRADLLVLDDQHVNLAGCSVEQTLGCFLFSGTDNLVRDVLCGGQWVVRDGRHVKQETIAARFKTAVADLRGA